MLPAGIFLESSPSLEDPNFDKAILFITEYNESGATGFVINKPFSRLLNELEEFSHIIPFPIYEGGPVETSKLYFIHRRPDLIESGAEISHGIYYGGDFKQAVEAINNGTLTGSDLKILIGYCGWDPGQLEKEIEEGSWAIIDNQLLFE